MHVSFFNSFESLIFENQSGKYSTYYRAVATGDHSPKIGAYVPISKLHSLEYASGPIGDMLRRFALEYQHGNFGLYLGGEIEGEIHAIGSE